jgi:hypothetical protein
MKILKFDQKSFHVYEGMKASAREKKELILKTSKNLET